MLVKRMMGILLAFFSAQIVQASDLGDVLECPGRSLQARFRRQSPFGFDSTLSRQDVLARVRELSPKLGQMLAVEIPKVEAALKWTSGIFSNRDGDSLNGCKLHQLYQKNHTIGGSAYFVVNKDIYQALSSTDQNVFMVEMTLTALERGDVFLEQIISAILKIESAFASRDTLDLSQWRNLVPVSVGVNCFVPIEYFGGLYCPQWGGGVFDAYDRMQSISVLGQSIRVDRLKLSAGQIWQVANYIEGFQFDLGASRLELRDIELDVNGIVTGGSFNPKKSSSLVCSLQRITGGTGVFTLTKDGCLSSRIYRKLSGRVMSRDGVWRRIPEEKSPKFDEEGFVTSFEYVW